MALVVGQSNYRNLPPLPNPVRDAREIEVLLAKLGFATDLATDTAGKKLRRTIDGFIEDADGADVALVYYSGHGIEAGGINYLIPIDAGISSLEAADENLISLQSVLERLRGKARITILLLDACRSNPFPQQAVVKRDAASAAEPITAAGLGVPRGATVIENAASSENIGEVIGFAAEPGFAALDGTAGTHSPYAAALIRHLAANAGYDFSQVMTMVTEEVYLATGARQRPWTNASLRRFLSFGGQVEEASSDDALLSGERRKLLLFIANTPAEMRAKVEGLARDRSLPLDPLYGMLKQLNVDTSKGPEELDKQLRAGAENLRDLIASKIAPLSDDPKLAQLTELADRAQAEGALDLAREYRAKASARVSEFDGKLDKIEEDIKTRRIQFASTYAAEAGTAMLTFDYQLAAAKYGMAYEQVAGKDEKLSIRYRLAQAHALSDHGDYKGENASLQKSAALYRTILASLQRDSQSSEWASAQIGLGGALTSLGERENGSNILNEAVAAYEAALTGLPREKNPADWAQAEIGLGNALHLRSDRESGTESLIKAAAAYELALTELTRESVPSDWARIQYGLGFVYLMLGEREEGTESLNRSVAAFKAALTVRTRDLLPLDWARTQIGLGFAFLRIFERGQGMEAETGAAFQAALEELRREQSPLDWAMAHMGLGNLYLSLGSSNWRAEDLNKAVAHYEAALLERTRERVPLDWAQTNSNLGLAYIQLALWGGDNEMDTERINRAIAYFANALAVLSPERTKPDWIRTRQHLGWAQLILGTKMLSLGRDSRDRKILLEGKKLVVEARHAYELAGVAQNYAFDEQLKKFDDALAELPQQP